MTDKYPIASAASGEALPAASASGSTPVPAAPAAPAAVPAAAAIEAAAGYEEWQCNEAAGYLLRARRAGSPAPRMPEAFRPPDGAAGWRVQNRVTGLLGEQVGGWKCAMPQPGQSMAAPLYASAIHRQDTARLLLADGQANFEPELAFILGRDLPARAEARTEPEMREAIGETRLALELIGARYDVAPDNLTFAELLADGMVNQGLFLGPVVEDALRRDLGAFDIVHGAGGAEDAEEERVAGKRLSGRHPAGDPLAPYYWLVRYLAGQGIGLFAGQAVITGSYAGLLRAPAGRPVSIVYGDLGTLKVTFEDAGPGAEPG